MKSAKKDAPVRNGSLSRRDFTRRAAVATAAIATLPSGLLRPRAAVAVGTSLSAANEPKLSPESKAEADAKIQAILRKYGDRLSEEQKADIRRLVFEGQKPLEALRAYKIDNSDQPGTVLRLYPDPSYGVEHPSRPAGAVRPRRKG